MIVGVSVVGRRDTYRESLVSIKACAEEGDRRSILGSGVEIVRLVMSAIDPNRIGSVRQMILDLTRTEKHSRAGTVRIINKLDRVLLGRHQYG